MIKLLGSVPRQVYVACSGGVDSMVAVDFLKNRHDVHVLFVHHGTAASDHGMLRVFDYCDEYNIPVLVKYLHAERDQNQSQEEFWRQERYSFFDELDTDWPVVTAHHLDDCVETYVWSMCHGTGKVVQYRRGRVIRPFLLNAKQELISWAQRHSLEWHEDASNQNIKYTRNLVRHEVLPKLLAVNPGLKTVVKNIVKRNFELDLYQN